MFEEQQTPQGDVNMYTSEEPLRVTTEGTIYEAPAEGEKTAEELYTEALTPPPPVPETVEDPEQNLENPKEYLEEQADLFKSLSDDNLDLMSLYESEFVANGSYSEKTLAALEAKGWTKQNIDIVSNAIQITTSKFTSDVVGIVGGEKNYTALQGWAKTNATDDELARYNAAIEQGDLGYAKLQLNAWQSKAQTTIGRKPAVSLQGLHAGNKSPEVQGFQSPAEQTAAINDPRFRQGGTYRDDVLKKMMASNFSYR